MNFKMLLGSFIPILLLFFSGTFAYLWFRKRDAIHVLALSGAFVAANAGFILGQFIFPKQSIFNVLIAQPFLLTAVGLLVWAVCKRAGIAFPIRLLAVAGIAGIAAAFWATEQFSTMNLRSFINNLTLGTFISVGAFSLFKARSNEIIDRILFVSFVAVAIQFATLSGVALMSSSSFDGSNYHGSAYWVLVNLFGGVSVLLLAASLTTACVMDTVAKTVQMSETDYLSGLKSRRAFEQAVTKAFTGLTQTPLPISLVIGDIDHFKRVNDTYGHQLGDQVIAAFGRLLNDGIRECDIAGRVGGEEFAILLWNSQGSGALLFAESIRTAFACGTTNDTHFEMDVSASFGVAELRPGESFDSLYHRADKALYEAKRGGRNRVVVAKTIQPQQDLSLRSA